MPRTVVVLVLAALAGLVLAEEPPIQREIALTVDDLVVNGPDPGLAGLRSMTDRLLGKLKAEETTGVAFVNEAKLYAPGEVDGRIDLLERWLAAGFELGNHTFSHPDFNRVGLAAYREEVLRGETVTRWLLARREAKLRWFRHTFLRTGATAEDRAAFEGFLAERGYTVAPVTIENEDWLFNQAYGAARRRQDGEAMQRVATAYLEHWTRMFDFYEGLAQRLFAREIRHVLLIHVNELNADTWERVAGLIRQRGYRFVPLEHALTDPAYQHADAYIGPVGKSWLHRWAWTDGQRETLREEPDPPAWIQQAATPSR